MPVTALRVPAVAGERRFGHAAREVENLQRRVVGCCDKLGVRRAERDVSDGILVAADALDVVEVWLPVFDHTFVVGRHEPVIAVRVGQSTDGAVVGLHDGLKVKARTVPERELAATGSRQQPATFRGPSHHVHGVLDLVERRVKVPGRYRVRGFCNPSAWRQ